MLTGSDLCDEPITRPENSECGVSECDSDASKIRTPGPTGAPCAMGEKNIYMTLKFPISHLIFIAKARLELQGGQNGEVDNMAMGKYFAK